MKKIFSLLIALSLVVLPVSAEKIYKLDDAIKVAAKGLVAKLPQGAKVVVYEVKADKSAASDYVVEQLTYELLQTGKVVVVDRQNLDAIRNELSLQVSGDVSDESAQRLGAMLGAETLITGSFDYLTDRYRLSMKAVKVETAEIQYLSASSVDADAQTEALFGRKTGTAKAVSTAGKTIRDVADFTGRLVCSSINPFFGIGSYMQGDEAGGGTVAFWEIAGGVCFGIGAFRDSQDLSNGRLLTGIGAGVVGVTVVYSLIRPWTYNRNKSLSEILDNVTVVQTDADSVSVGYTVKY